MTEAPIDQYRQAAAESAANSYNPHQLIQMLFDGALERIATAKGHQQRNEIAAKCEQTNKAIDIIIGLQASLKRPEGGEIADNLYDLYRYMIEQLTLANNGQIDKYNEVSDLLKTIKEGWDGIEEQAREIYKSALSQTDHA
jgi:flagellar protein FliS